jgi:hypothetical protein
MRIRIPFLLSFPSQKTVLDILFAAAIVAKFVQK